MERSHLDMILGKNHIITTTDLGALKFYSFLSYIFIFIKSNPMVKECDRVVWITGIPMWWQKKSLTQLMRGAS